MSEKRETPYQRLLKAAQGFWYALPRSYKSTMFFWPKNRLREGWVLDDVYERTKAADQLGFDVIVTADYDGLRMQYRKRQWSSSASRRTQAGKVIAVTDTPQPSALETWRNPFFPVQDRLDMCEVAVMFERRVVANLRSQLAAATARLEAAEKDAARWNAFIDASVIDNIGRQPGYTHKLLADSRKLVDGVIDAMSKEAANKHVDAAIDAAQGSNP